MVTKDEDLIDGLVRVWSDWRSEVPDRLARQDPSVVARLLRLGLRKGGIKQSDLQLELHMNQPQLSKLTDKLRRAGWIKLKASAADRRIRMTTTTVKAQEKLATLRKELEGLLLAQTAVQAPTPLPQSKPAPVRRPLQPTKRVPLGRSRIRKPIPPREGGFLPQLLAADTKS